MPIAELNVGRSAHDLDDPRMAGFMDNLERINALAERSPGFIWRYTDASGNATDTKIGGDPRAILNLSVWETMEDLEAYVFGTVHVQFYARKAEWFEALDRPHFVMWEVETGHRPTVEEALARLEELRTTGPSARVFGWEALPNAELWKSRRCA
ncbi:MAG: DUF3291 domain-containing protein [Pseudomonadota bacterium]